jgi:hypothetical protein
MMQQKTELIRTLHLRVNVLLHRLKNHSVSIMNESELTEIKILIYQNIKN